MAPGQGVPASHHGAQERLQGPALLQIAQALGVGGGDVDHRVGGQVGQGLQDGEVVSGSVGEGVAAFLPRLTPSKEFPGSERGGAPARPRPALPRGEVSQEGRPHGRRAPVGEAHAVDQGPFGGEAEDARAGVARLAPGGDRAHLHRAQAQGGEGAGARASLSSPASLRGWGRSARRRAPSGAGRARREALQEGQGARGALGQPQQAQGQVVGPLRVEAPQDARQRRTTR